MVLIKNCIVKNQISIWRPIDLALYVFSDQSRRYFLSTKITIYLIVRELLSMIGKVRQRIVDMTDQQMLAILQSSHIGFHGQNSNSFSMNWPY